MAESPESPKLPLTFIRGPYEPLLIDHAEGAWLYTADGGKILDAAAGAVVTNIGQGREEIAELMAEEARRANYVVPIWSTPQRQRLVERLSRWTPPGLTRFFFTSGGSEAVEAALKFALMYHKVNGRPQRTKIIAREASYHGNSIAALSAGGSLRRADYEQVLFDWPKIKPSYCYRCPWDKTYPGCNIDCADALEDEINRHGEDTIAAFIAEPMMGSAGGSVPPVKEYWPRLAEICRRHGVLLIADEVMTGFGRTGRHFAVDHWNVTPDILVGGKGLTGGYMPMGMIAVQQTLVEQCEAKGADFMFYTYSSHPIACAVADRVLEIMEREHLVERAAELGARLGAQLKEELSGHPMVGDIRGTGMFWGVEMVRDRVSRAPYPVALKVASRVVGAGLKRGLFVYPATGMARPGGDAVMVTPPFVIATDEVEYIVRRLRATLDDVHPNLR
jgi:adenosylmethionine-8-amino-7-oxononanoate aminotransferase